MKRSVFVAILAILFFVASGFCQAPPLPPAEKPPVNGVAAGPCPNIQIQAPSGRIIRDGQPITFAVNIAGGDPNVAPTLVWNTSAGTIVSGQGTKSIHVDSTGAGSNREIVADLWIGGYSGECSLQATAGVKVAGPAAKTDEFGELSIEKEIERLAAFAESLPQANDHIVIFAYAGRTSARGFAAAGLRRIKAQLMTSGVPSERISTTDGGFREQPSFEFWLVPDGSEAPRPTPTIDRKDIVYPKTVPTKPAAAKKP